MDGRTPDGPGATVRYDLSHRPLPAIPLPIDTATWPDPTSRTGLRINASLIAPTNIEQQARQRFSQMEGWGTFAPISISFDLPRAEYPDEYGNFGGPALDLANIRARHQGDDYDFADDAVYLVNLTTGVPMVLDIGGGNFNYTLKKLDKYWANDTRKTERNLLFETIDETKGGTITSYAPEHDTDFDGVLDIPNFENPSACPGPDPICDDTANTDYWTEGCINARQERDRCVADNLLTFYERETDTLIVRPLLPLDEMTRYAVVLTNRVIDGKGHAVKSPFEFKYHAQQQQTAAQVKAFINDPYFQSYYGDMAGTGLENVSFVWSFTTQPTVDDMKRLRDGLFGQGPFSRWATDYPAHVEVQRATGLTANLAAGGTDEPGWVNSDLGAAAGCPQKVGNLWIMDYDGVREKIRDLIVQGFEIDDGPAAHVLLRRFDAISHMVIGTFEVPFLLEGGPDSTDPNSAFNLNFQTGEGVESSDTVQFWLIVPKETEQHQQPFDVNIYGHGYTGNFVEMILYAGNMAEHGLATIGINAMGHGLVFEDDATQIAAKAALGGACYAPFFDALTLTRTRDLNNDGIEDSGGDFWSSYLFHTRDGVRQSVLDHVQLVRLMRAWGTAAGSMGCRNDAAEGAPVTPCDHDNDGELQIAGDFDGDGLVDAGGTTATYGTWGESLGGILSAIHGAVDTHVTSAVPGSGGGGLTDIGVRSFQGGVIEAVLLRIWGPLLVGVKGSERNPCTLTSKDKDHCSECNDDQISVRWVLPDVNGTGEVEIDCVDPALITSSTIIAANLGNDERACARVDGEGRFRVGLPTSTGDQVLLSFWDGADNVDSYDSCIVPDGTAVRHTIKEWGDGRFGEGSVNGAGTSECSYETCNAFQGRFFGEGTPLTAPGAGFGLIRQTPALRRFISLAQAALDPGDPINFAPYYALKPMTDSFGQIIDPHAVLTINTIGDMNVPLNSGIALARATGALPFLRPEQEGLYPDYRDFVTPQDLYDDLGGRTPNQDLIDRHVIEGITALARHPAGSECSASANAAPPEATYLDLDGNSLACYPTGCTEQTEGNAETRICFSGTHCDVDAGACVPNQLGGLKCEEALWDPENLDEDQQLYFEQRSSVPHRLARLTASANDSSVNDVWRPRLKGVPFGADADAWVPLAAPAGRMTALLNAYTVPQGEHTFVNGEPCQAWDHGTYLTNLVARFFESDGTDIYYLSHPATHDCLETSDPICDYATGE